MRNALIHTAVCLLIAGSFAIAPGAIAAPPGGVTSHKCTSAVSAAKLQEKIDAASEGDVIEVSGDCLGFNYTIATDKLTLRGVDGATITGDGLAPAITVAADRVVIADWAAIDGATNVGVSVGRSGSAEISNVGALTGSNGVLVTESAFANIVGSHLSDNTAASAALLVSLGGHARVQDTEVSGNNRRGIVIVNTGTAHIAGGTTINDNREEGIFILHGSLLLDGADNYLQGNATAALVGDRDINCFNYSRITVNQPFANPAGSEAFFECWLSLGQTTVFSPAP